MPPMETLYQTYAQAIYAYLLSLTRQPDLAEELTQETFYQAVKSADRFDGSCQVLTWLSAIAKHTLLAYNRKHPPAAALEEEKQQNSASSSPEEALLAQDFRLTLLTHLHQLEEPLREVMYLRIFGQLSFREIGQILSRSENWARVTYYRGKERIKKELNHDEGNHSL